jgi:hypothetical protein
MKKLLSTVAILLALSAASAKADYMEEIINYDNGDALYVYHYTDKDGKEPNYTYRFLFDGQGKLEWEGYGSNNPNWEDGAKGTNDPQDIVNGQLGLGLQKGGGVSLAPDFAATPLGKFLTGKAKGKGPVYQPGDDETPGHHSSTAAPMKSPEQIAKEKNEEIRAALKGAMPHKELDANGGSVAGQIKDHVKGGGGGGPKPKGGGPTGDKKGKSVGANDSGKVPGQFYGDLPGPPEIVNPSWDGGKTAQKTRTAQATVKCAPTMRLNASGKGCLPSLDMGGIDSVGSTMRVTPGAPAGAGAASPRHGR